MGNLGVGQTDMLAEMFRDSNVFRAIWKCQFNRMKFVLTSGRLVIFSEVLSQLIRSTSLACARLVAPRPTGLVTSESKDSLGGEQRQIWSSPE